MYLPYVLTLAYLPNFSSPIAFTHMVSQNFPRQILPLYGNRLQYYVFNCYYNNVYYNNIKYIQK